MTDEFRFAVKELQAKDIKHCRKFDGANSLSEKWCDTSFAPYVDNDTKGLFVARCFETNAVVGYIAFWNYGTFEKQIRKLVIHRQYQSSGIATALIDRVHSMSLDQRTVMMPLETDLRLQMLLKSLGFSCVKIKKDLPNIRYLFVKSSRSHEMEWGFYDLI